MKPADTREGGSTQDCEVTQAMIDAGTERVLLYCEHQTLNWAQNLAEEVIRAALQAAK